MFFLRVCRKKKPNVRTLVYKVPYSPNRRGGGEFIKSVGEEYKVVNWEENIMAVGKNITWKGKGKRKGNHYHLPYNIMAVEKNIKWGRGDGNFGEENKYLLKMGVEKNIKL